MSDVTSVNGQTGDVEIGVEQLDDYALRLEPGDGYPYRVTGPNYDGENVFLYAGSDMYVSMTDANGNDVSGALPAAGSGPGTITWILNGVSYYFNYDVVRSHFGDTFRSYDADTPQDTTNWPAAGTLIELSTGSPPTIPLANGNVLLYNSSLQKWEPQPLPSSVIPPSGIVWP